MKLSNDKYQVEILIDRTYTMQSTDNRHYDYTFNPNNLTRKDVTKAFNIHVYQNDNEKRYVLIGSLYSKDNDCAVLNGSLLTVLINDSISQIDLESNCIINHKVIDEDGCFFAIHKISNGYIVHGEFVVLKVDLLLNVTWTFSGADIFVTQDDHPAFQIINDRIVLRDWNNDIYELDMYGQLIS